MLSNSDKLWQSPVSRRVCGPAQESVKLELGFAGAAQILDLRCILELVFLHTFLSESSSGLSLSILMVHD